jgi:hypothetical protein
MYVVVNQSFKIRVHWGQIIFDLFIFTKVVILLQFTPFLSAITMMEAMLEQVTRGAIATHKIFCSLL